MENTKTVVILTAKGVAKAALAAMEEGRLGFQNGMVTCRYRDKETGSCCAVGASLPDDFPFEEQYPAHSGSEINRVTFSELPSDLVQCSKKDRLAINQIQTEHDSICSSKNILENDTREDEERFKDLLLEIING